MKPRNELTAERLRELVHYDPETGAFTRRMATGRHGRWRAGAGARGAMSHGYMLISIDCKKYFAHRLAWLYMTGGWPKKQIDHINGIRNDNRWCNLREATAQQNQANRSTFAGSSVSGFKGVSWKKDTRKWGAKITIEDKGIHLGTFHTRDEAYTAYRTAAIKAFGEYARVDSDEEIARRDREAMWRHWEYEGAKK